MRKLLFVCSGNTCRSPLALAAWRALAQAGKAPPDVEADSAGLAAATGSPAAAHTAKIARDWQQDLSVHRSKPLLPEAAQSADWIAVMNPAHAHALREYSGVAPNKILLLGTFDSQENDPEILDPFGGSREAYETCAARIRRSVAGLAKEIARGQI